MDTKICINPSCKNVLRAQDIYCGYCGFEQPQQPSPIEVSVPETTVNNHEPRVTLQAEPSLSIASKSLEDIHVGESLPSIIPIMQGISSSVPSPDLIGHSCPVCLTDLYPTDDNSREMIVECPACHSYHHQKCWEVNRGCSTYGCKFTPSAEVQVDNITFPVQDEVYSENPYAFTGAVPRVAHKVRSMAIVANLELLFGLLPFLAPLAMIFGIAVVVFNRQGLQELSPSHRMRFWVGFIAGCAIMLLFIFAGVIYLIT